MNRRAQKLLFVYPDFDPTYWGMQYALPLVGRRSFMPPLGLMTIAAMTPRNYDVRIVDMNCEPLLRRADRVGRYRALFGHDDAAAQTLSSGRPMSGSREACCIWRTFPDVVH